MTVRSCSNNWPEKRARPRSAEHCGNPCALGFGDSLKNSFLFSRRVDVSCFCVLVNCEGSAPRARRAMCFGRFKMRLGEIEESRPRNVTVASFVRQEVIDVECNQVFWAITCVRRVKTSWSGPTSSSEERVESSSQGEGKAKRFNVTRL